jgi:hypothetical protein
LWFAIVARRVIHSNAICIVQVFLPAPFEFLLVAKVLKQVPPLALCVFEVGSDWVGGHFWLVIYLQRK